MPIFQKDQFMKFPEAVLLQRTNCCPQRDPTLIQYTTTCAPFRERSNERLFGTYEAATVTPKKPYFSPDRLVLAICVAKYRSR